MDFADFSDQSMMQQGPPGGRPPGPAPQGMPWPQYQPGHPAYQAPAPPAPTTNYLGWGLALAAAAAGIWWIGKQDEEFEKKQLAQNAVEAAAVADPSESDPSEEDDEGDEDDDLEEAA